MATTKPVNVLGRSVSKENRPVASRAEKLDQWKEQRDQKPVGAKRPRAGAAVATIDTVAFQRVQKKSKDLTVQVESLLQEINEKDQQIQQLQEQIKQADKGSDLSCAEDDPMLSVLTSRCKDAEGRADQADNHSKVLQAALRRLADSYQELINSNETLTQSRSRISPLESHVVEISLLSRISDVDHQFERQQAKVQSEIQPIVHEDIGHFGCCSRAEKNTLVDELRVVRSSSAQMCLENQRLSFANQLLQMQQAEVIQRYIAKIDSLKRTHCLESSQAEADLTEFMASMERDMAETLDASKRTITQLKARIRELTSKGADQ